MLTPEELTQARALSSPEIPDDDEKAKQPTRQLVRKMLAHIGFISLHHAECKYELCQAIRNSTNAHVECDRIHTKLHAALDAKEKAEACREEAEDESNKHKASWQELQVFKERAEADLSEIKIEHKREIKKAMVAEAKVAELQAIVDRLPRTADGVPVTDGKVLWRIRHRVAVSGPFVVCGEGENYYAKAYNCYSTREAALSAAASSKKETK